MDQSKTLQKRKYIFIALSLGLLIILFAATYFYMKRQKLLAARYNLLCEVLNPNMSMDEILSTLDQAGDFTTNLSEYDLAYGDFDLTVNFTDPEGKELYGGFRLAFFHHKYVTAYLRAFEDVDVICDLSQATQSVTVTPKQLP